MQRGHMHVQLFYDSWDVWLSFISFWTNVNISSVPCPEHIGVCTSFEGGILIVYSPSRLSVYSVSLYTIKANNI